jgi:hypothetical protein
LACKSFDEGHYLTCPHTLLNGINRKVGDIKNFRGRFQLPYPIVLKSQSHYVFHGYTPDLFEHFRAEVMVKK